MSFLNSGSYFIGYKTSSGSFKDDEGNVVDYDNILMYLVTLNPDDTYVTSYIKVKRGIFLPYIDSGVAPDVETLLDTFLCHRLFMTIDSSSKNKDVIFIEFHPTSQINLSFS